LLLLPKPARADGEVEGFGHRVRLYGRRQVLARASRV